MKILGVIFLINFSFQICFQQEVKCGYDACPKLSTEKINVHIVPHSHDDVGWLKTVDEYYYGVSTKVSVENIITSVLQALKRNPSRRFTQVETAYLWKWWQNQPDKTKEEYKQLVDNGQIEIANGGWVMNDEACANYQTIIDQFTLGLRIINETLGNCGTPKTGWQIDTFGHSRQQAYIYNLLGYDGVFFARLDYRDRRQRMKTNSLDFLWKSSSNVDKSEMLYSILMNHYESPKGFCFDALCTDDSIVNSIKSTEYNADRKRIEFEKVLEDFANHSTTNNILIPMGGDFNYESAEQQYINIDKLINLFINHDKYNLFYSSPSCYTKAVKDSSPKLTVKTDDFFPYASDVHEYWTGYFTSRPNLKRLERVSHNILQANKFLRAIYHLKNPNSAQVDDSDLTTFQQSVSTLLHHDAITGTEKNDVANNYNIEIQQSIKKTEERAGEIIGKLLSKSGKAIDGLKMSSCSSEETCDISKKDKIIVVVYNPLSKPITTVIRLPVDKTDFSVTGSEASTDFEVVKSIKSNNNEFMEKPNTATNYLLISAKDVPPMGMNLYYVTAKKSKKLTNGKIKQEPENLKFGTEDTNFILDDISYKLKSVTMRNVTLDIEQDFYYYQSENGVHDSVASGAYLFRPLSGTGLKKITYQPGVLEYSYRGNIVDEAHIRINEWIKQIIRVYKSGSESHIEFEWTVGPIQVNESSLCGKEIVTRFEVANFKNKGIFFTDSNGREMIQRTKNARQDYPFEATDESISSNYYPITSKILIRDEEKKLEVAVLNDRAQGGTSLIDGKIEIMLHRRLLVDDQKGLGQALNDSSIITGKHILVFGRTNETSEPKLAVSEKNLQLVNLMAPYQLVADATADTLSLDKIKDSLAFQFKFLPKALPNNVNILSFEKWNEGSFLLRLEHTMEKDEDSELSQKVQINLGELFEQKPTFVKETTLGANQWLDGNERPDKITLLPMQIKTFILKF